MNLGGESSTQSKRGLCGLCNVGCWIVAKIDEYGRIVAIEPDKDSPMGMLCDIGKKAPELIYSSDRIKQPLKRVGPKGTYQFEPITWDEAFETIVARLEHSKEEHGAEATAIYTGVGSFELAHCDVYQPKDVAVSSASSVLFPFGSPNTMGVGALCYVAYGMIAPHVTMGRMFMNMYSDIENAELIVVWGTNPATDIPPIDMDRIIDARKNGADVVVIDPKKTETVKLSEGQWVPIRPGTDGALALGLCNVLVEEELFDEKFVADWTEGFDEFVGYVQHFRPEVVEHITGIPAKTVTGLARRIGSARGVSQLMYTGMEYSGSGVQNIRATLVLWALAGQLDVPGGLCFAMDKNFFPINRSGNVANPDVGPRLGKEKFPVYIKYRDEAHAIALPQSVLKGDPYRIRNLVVLGGSIITSWPGASIWRETMGALEFLVTIDRQLTADSAYADIVLPASTHFETTSYMTYGSIFKIREQMIEPVGDSRPDMWILAELASRLGYGHLYPQNPEELLSYVLDGSGFTPQQVREAGGEVSIDTEIMQYKKWEKGLLRSDGKPGFDTPSGKFEIASSILEEFGYDSLPTYTEPKEGPLSQPELAKQFPLVFNSGARVKTRFHTQHHGVKSLSKGKNAEPVVTIHSLDAALRNITDGDLVEISTTRASLRMRAHVTEDIVQGSIDANHGGGSPLGSRAWQESNVNLLTDLDNHDPISGFPTYRALLCEVTKVDNDHKVVEWECPEDSHPSIKYQVENQPDCYLDNNATTPISKPVQRAMAEAIDSYGNPSSIHQQGRAAKNIIDDARRKVARALGCTARRIVFTGSGTESNNLAIKGVYFSQTQPSKHIVTSMVEHPSVLNTCKWLETLGANVTYLPVDKNGLVKPESFKAALTEETVLASIMVANNETGVMQPIAEIASIAKEFGLPLHVDAVQSFGKTPLDLQSLDVDLLSISAHKIHGPKGIGALFVRKGVSITDLMSGGDQEHGLRAATENLLGIVGLGAAALEIEDSLKQMSNTVLLRDRLQQGILSEVPDARVVGIGAPRLPNTLSLIIPGIRGESLVLEMDKRGIYISSGSACKSGTEAPSSALLAMGLSEEEAHCTIRFSLGIENTTDQVQRTLAVFTEIVKSSKNIVRFISCK